jgi:hypothetical protein
LYIGTAQYVAFVRQFSGYPVLNVGMQFDFILPLFLHLEVVVHLKRQLLGLGGAADGAGASSAARAGAGGEVKFEAPSVVT